MGPIWDLRAYAHMGYNMGPIWVLYGLQHLFYMDTKMGKSRCPNILVVCGIQIHKIISIIIIELWCVILIRLCVFAACTPDIIE